MSAVLDGLDGLYAALRAAGYTVVGPTPRDGAIVLAELGSAAEPPRPGPLRAARRPVRASGTSRYRQWLTHKLGTWHDRFGTSGCVGCGRCIVWCPAGIDLTAEVAALKEEKEVSGDDHHVGGDPVRP